MPHDKLFLDKYLPVLSVFYNFYRYAEGTLGHEEIVKKIQKSEVERFFNMDWKKYVAEPHHELFKKSVDEDVRHKVAEDIETGLTTLRQQLLVACFSILENFLAHVVRVYLHIFPQLLKSVEKSVEFRTIVDLRDDINIFDYIVEKEVETFSRKSLESKIQYLRNRLYITDETIWIDEGDEMWPDIDRKRNSIVHAEELPDISIEFLLRTINYCQRAMMIICLHAQSVQGVPFVWAPMQNYVKKKEPPTLR